MRRRRRRYLLERAEQAGGGGGCGASGEQSRCRDWLYESYYCMSQQHPLLVFLLLIVMGACLALLAVFFATGLVRGAPGRDGTGREGAARPGAPRRSCRGRRQPRGSPTGKLCRPRLPEGRTELNSLNSLPLLLPSPLRAGMGVLGGGAWVAAAPQTQPASRPLGALCPGRPVSGLLTHFPPESLGLAGSGELKQGTAGRRMTAGIRLARPESPVCFCPCVEGEGEAAEGSKILAPRRGVLLVVARGGLLALPGAAEVEKGV